MQESIESPRVGGTQKQQAQASGTVEDGLGAHASAAPDLIYDLRLTNGSSDAFYTEAAHFADEVLTRIDSQAGSAIRGYADYVQTELKEGPRSLGEYSIELLTLGMALNRYANAAAETPGWVVGTLEGLYRLRTGSERIKPMADRARAMLGRWFLLPAIARRAVRGAPAVGQLTPLIEWMQATGEFEQEALRFNHWRRFFGTLSPAQAKQWMVTAIDLFEWFEREADESLGAYTRGVSRFLEGEYAARSRSFGGREDQVFCGRPAVEYHLGMVAAEIMNRGLRSDFERSRQRVVLVPACMRGSHAVTCRAHTSGIDITCSGCDPACSVNRITRRARSVGAHVYLVPHATGFSRWLDRWQQVPDIGIVAVACMLNILPGGLEMRARSIASQCVPLDYPGCKKHWSKEGIPTGANEERLLHLVQIGPPVAT